MNLMLLCAARSTDNGYDNLVKSWAELFSAPLAEQSYIFTPSLCCLSVTLNGISILKKNLIFKLNDAYCDA